MNDELREQLVSEFRTLGRELQDEIVRLQSEKAGADRSPQDEADAAQMTLFDEEIVGRLAHAHAQKARVCKVVDDLLMGWDGICGCGESVMDRLVVGNPTHTCTPCKVRQEKRGLPRSPGLMRIQFA